MNARVGCAFLSSSTRYEYVGMGFLSPVSVVYYQLLPCAIVRPDCISPWNVFHGLSLIPVFLGPTAFTTASTTSSANLARFSGLPPYASVRRLDDSFKNCSIRYPFAP